MDIEWYWYIGYIDISELTFPHTFWPHVLVNAMVHHGIEIPVDAFVNHYND